MAQSNLAEELIRNIESTIDVNASPEQQLKQLRSQLAALSQLPSIIQQTVQRLNDRINSITQREQQKRMQVQNIHKTNPVQIKITKPSASEDELAIVRKEEVKKILNTKMREEKLKREMGFTKTNQQSRQSDKATPSFGRLQEQSRILSRRKWYHTDDVYDEDMINEALLGQAEVIKGKAIGVNFMKFQKPPPPLDHLKHSEVFKAIHEQEH
ncbi:uncharacterized protein LOC116778407 [Danaus plexippus]|uniref:uncharacterized protein LOC116778407 n=1 Tax=Danaus plexippus TaxID=13037 RepID=UPI002AB13E7B|nr:uncharacterized protein LOC116778407 [Danaus plexippus]